MEELCFRVRGWEHDILQFIQFVEKEGGIILAAMEIKVGSEQRILDLS